MKPLRLRLHQLSPPGDQYVPSSREETGQRTSDDDVIIAFGEHGVAWFLEQSPKNKRSQKSERDESSHEHISD